MKSCFLLVMICILLHACTGTPMNATSISPLIPMVTAISSPTVTITPLPPTSTPKITPTPVHPLGKVEIHPADEEILYDWFSYVPGELNKNEKVYIWITSETSMPLDDYEEISKRASSFAHHEVLFAEEYNYVLLTLAIPRPKTNHIYVIAYNPRVFLDQTPAMYQRPDLQLNKMIAHLSNLLRADGYDVSEKVFIDGYSAGCMFAQRYAILNPEGVKAVAGGQCGGSLTLPDPKYNWPVGIRDFEKLTGKTFNETAYREIPQFFYIGDLDINNSTAHIGNVDVFTEGQINILFSLFGNQDPVRIGNQVKYMNEMGYTNVYFTLYPGVKHEMTKQMRRDSFDFFNQNK
ncbi:MAG: hypothetical protein AB9891_07470 [Anaerolineaceae bacterium]